MLMLLFWIIFIIAVILYFTFRPHTTNAYISVTPFVLFMIDIAILGYKVFGFTLGN